MHPFKFGLPLPKAAEDVISPFACMLGKQSNDQADPDHRPTDETLIKQTAKTQEFPRTCSKPEGFTSMLGVSSSLKTDI